MRNRVDESLVGGDVELVVAVEYLFVQFGVYLDAVGLDDGLSLGIVAC